MTNLSIARRINRLFSIFAIAFAGTSLLKSAFHNIENNESWGKLRQLDNTKPSISNPETMKIHFYLKTSGLERYFKRAKLMIKTWGMDAAAAGKITLMLDGKNKEDVDKFGKQNPFINIMHVDGTDRQGDYKGSKSDEDKMAAYRAQRIKTRAVFEDFASNEDDENDDNKRPDWVCYLDDDMMVNVDNLKHELARMYQSCTPNCFVADGAIFWGGIKYTCGGYCMERNLASRIQSVLSTKTDEELKWDETDDLSFNIMLKHELNVTRIDSEYWYSQLSKPKVKGTVVEKMNIFDDWYQNLVAPTWERNPVFMRNWVPTLSVFNYQYAPPVDTAES